VKHFKFEERGKRRIHQKPTAGEVKHYRWWLEKELELIRPKLVVALGGTAVLAMTGKSVPITRVRGPMAFRTAFDGYVTVHPSYLLRLPDEARRRRPIGSSWRSGAGALAGAGTRTSGPAGGGVSASSSWSTSSSTRPARRSR
jgi:hypothetical protein